MLNFLDSFHLYLEELIELGVPESQVFGELLHLGAGVLAEPALVGVVKAVDHLLQLVHEVPDDVGAGVLLRNRLVAHRAGLPDRNLESNEDQLREKVSSKLEMFLLP